MRASSADDNIQLIPPKLLNLEQALDFIKEDELAEKLILQIAYLS